MITFYQAAWCPQSHLVRQLLTELGLTYTAVSVAADPDERPDVVALSGQSSVPVLQDGDKVFAGTDDIVAYLRSTYPPAEDAAEHARKGAWRFSRALSVPPRTALARLKELLGSKGFTVVTQTRGQKIAEHLPAEYVLLQVTVPVAATKAFELDPLAPTAILLPMAVAPAEGGGSVVASADPVGQVWLYNDPALIRIQGAVKKRVRELFAEL